MSYENKGSMAYVVTVSVEPDRSGNFVCNGVNDSVEIQAAIDHLATLTDAGTLYIKQGVYDMGAGNSITFTASTRPIVRGDGRPATNSSPLASGGTVLSFSDDGQLTAGGFTRLTFIDMSFYFVGTYTDSCIDLFHTDGNHVNSYRCFYYVIATVPNGSATTPDTTPSGVSLIFGRFGGGPQGVPYVWRDNIFVDARQGISTDNTFLGFYPESLVFDGNYIHCRSSADLVTPIMFWAVPVSWAHITNFTGFHEGGWLGSYEHQFLTGGPNKNWLMDNVQFLDPAWITGSHFSTEGELFVYGKNPVKMVAGLTPVLPSIGGGGTVHIRFSGRGYEHKGEASVANAGTIAHTLVAAPTMVQLTMGAIDSQYYVAENGLGAANVTVYLYDLVAVGVELVAKDVHYDFRYYT